MRLLLVIPNIISYRSFLSELCEALCADGVEVHVACSTRSLWSAKERTAQLERSVHLHGVTFPRGMNPAGHFRAARELNRLVESLQPDLVHAHFSATIFTTAMAMTSRWPATIATFHGVSFLAMSGWKRLLLRAMEVWATKRFDKTWVLTDCDRDGLRAAAPGAVVSTLPSAGVGCDLEKFKPVSRAERNAARAQFGFSDDQCVFAFVGRYVEFKGFTLAVRAFLRLLETNPAARLLLIGARDRMHPTGLTAEEEQALTQGSQIVDAGYRDDVEQCLAAADLLAFPSCREGMPVSVMEALALGIPVITTDSRGCRDVVRDGVDGVVLRDRSVEGLCAAMKQASEDSKLRQRWASEARAGRDRFDRGNFIEQQTRIYESLTACASMVTVALCL
jgi:glycosyltransferase involved in cell wall biosynthesis